jgi:hypothetical protein
MRVGFIAVGYPLQPGPDAFCFGGILLASIALRLCARAWLVRATAQELGEQTRSTCRGLFLECEEPLPGRFRFAVRGITYNLHVREAWERTLNVTLPPTTDRSKVTLLIQWLSKQYPGPLPRIRRDLTRSKPS